MFRRLLAHLLLACTLLFAQQGALAHALSHLSRAEAPAEKQLPHHGSCDQCVSHAPLAAGLAAHGPALPVAQPGVSPGVPEWPAPATASSFAPLSRAPPVLA